MVAFCGICTTFICDLSVKNFTGWGGGKLNWKCQVSNRFFLGGGGGGAEVANIYKHVFGRDGRV